jgi:hypothetical protein
MMPRLIAWLLLAVAVPCASRAGSLPMDVVFKGQSRFEALVSRAKSQEWKALPIGQRAACVGAALAGTPYRNFTLEIDDRIEAPSVNLNALDCWTLFEVSLAFARMLDEDPADYTPQTMLRYIEMDRYRNGECTGSYLSRLHFLAEWMFDNQRRGLVKDMSRSLGGVRFNHKVDEMSKGWRQYRYLVANPRLIPEIRRIELRDQKLPVYHIPKSRVRAIEPFLQNGDIIGITTHGDGEFCSHVGLAVRDSADVLRFMHASSNYRRVVIDKRLSEYLHDFPLHAGIIVARPVR